MKNIRQVHILTPHWNIPVMNQAIGRSIRKFSHISLNEEFRKVEIYLHCAIGKYENNGDKNINNDDKILKLSIDYYKYKCAQQKFNKIVVLNKLLKDNSINKMLNYPIENPIKDINYFTYKAFYSDSISNYITNMIKNKINEKTYNSLLKITFLDKINIDNKILNNILFKRVINKKIIHDNYSQLKIISYNTNIIYLDKYNNIDNTPYIHIVRDIKTDKNICIKKDLPIILTKLNKKQLNVLKYPTICLDFINKMFMFNINELVEILEYSVIINNKLIMKYFDSFLIEHNSILYHNLCYLDLTDKICSYSIASGNYNILYKTRIYNKKWDYLKNSDLENTLKNISKERLHEFNSKNKFNVYLLISNADKCFRLCNRINNKNITDNRKIGRGKRLESFTPKELYLILNYLFTKISYVYIINIKRKFNLNDLDGKDKFFFQEIIKDILFTNKMYLIH